MAEKVAGTTFVELWLGAEDGYRLEQLADAAKCSQEEILLKLIRRCDPALVGNGHNGVALTCSGCGLPFFAARRPPKDWLPWCEDCRTSGAPERARQKRYRDSHRGGSDA